MAEANVSTVMTAAATTVARVPHEMEPYQESVARHFSGLLTGQFLPSASDKNRARVATAEEQDR